MKVEQEWFEIDDLSFLSFVRLEIGELWNILESFENMDLEVNRG